MQESCPAPEVGHVKGGHPPEAIEGPKIDASQTSQPTNEEEDAAIETLELDVEQNVVLSRTNTEAEASSATTDEPQPTVTPESIVPVAKELLHQVTSRERFNYASSGCAAIVVHTNKEASHASAILHENKDSYMLMPCKVPNKTVVVELCDDVLVDALALANYEIFSSTVKDFSVYVSAQATDGWKLLGNFKAANTREIQAFRVPDPKLWARYIRLDLDNFHGREVFCPLSLLRIHGRTMIDELREEDSKQATPAEGDGLKEVEDILIGAAPIVDPSLSLRPFRRARENMGVQRYNEPVDYGPLDLAETDVQQDFSRLYQRHFGAKQQQGETESAPNSSSEKEKEKEPAPAQASDGIFRSMLKRLSLLERNFTASSRYLQDEVQIVHHYFSLVFGRLNNVSRTLQREVVSGSCIRLSQSNQAVCAERTPKPGSVLA
jgi:hypothetical protein